MKSNRSIQLALAMGAFAVVPALAAAQTGGTSTPQHRESGTPGAAQGGAQHQGDKPSPSGAQRGQQQQQGQGQKKQAIKLQEQISFPVEEGCTYTASVNGRIDPVATGKSQQPSGGQTGGGNLGRGGAGEQGHTDGSQAQAHAGGAQGGSQPHAGAQAGAAQAGGQAGPGADYREGQEKVKPNLTVAASVSCPNAVDLKVSDTLKTDKAVSRSELEEMISRRTSIATEKGGRFCMYVPQFELTREKLSGKGIAQLCRVPAAAEKGGMP
ncbi:hypothetical protein [Sorangium atrum]|uniref:Secreted protein n=1 Tax=Sorangium atrum TaxID=2995308 RepID=A0ABT5CFZ3_9BACT|nr:hypothetical protein [Sorangium aterium]MDC0685346.1 hypothetical protein [Sorangium aterium]